MSNLLPSSSVDNSSPHENMVLGRTAGIPEARITCDQDEVDPARKVRPIEVGEFNTRICLQTIVSTQRRRNRSSHDNNATTWCCLSTEEPKPSFFSEHTTPNIRTFNTTAHVIFSRCSRLSQGSSLCLCLDKTLIFTSGTPCLTRSRCCSFAGPLLHIPLALQIRLPCCSLDLEMTTATIHDTERRLAKWLNRTYLQVVSPTISLK